MSSRDVRTFPGDYQAVFGAACAAAQAEKMTIVSADPAIGVINVATSMSAMNWGENLSITVGLAPHGGVAVAVQSKLKFGLVDWGRNKKNLARLYDRIADTLGNPSGGQVPPPSGPARWPAAPELQPAAQVPQAGAWHADPTGRHELRYWNGSAWTDHVSDQAVVSTDPVGGGSAS